MLILFLMLIAALIAGAAIIHTSIDCAFFDKAQLHPITLRSIAGMLLIGSSSCLIGILLTGYDSVNECSYKKRAETQTELHANAMNMLQQYYNKYPDYFWDEISNSGAYIRYNDIVQGNWEFDFGFQDNE